MKLKVVRAFVDKVKTYKTYKVGEIITLPDVRAKDAIAKGLAVEISEETTKEISEEATEEKTETKAKAKPRKRAKKKEE